MSYFKAFENDAKESTLYISEFVPAANNKIESVFTQSNGRMGIRGTQELPCLNRKPQTYLAGFYHQASSGEPDELVNLPDLTSFTITVGNTQLSLEDKSSLLEYQRYFDLSTNELNTIQVFKVTEDLVVRVESSRFVSFAAKSLFCQRMRIQLVGNSLPLTVQTGIDGQICNEGVTHLERLKFRVFQDIMVSQAMCGDRPVLLQSAIKISEGTKKFIKRKDYLLSRRRIICSIELLPSVDCTYELVKVSRIDLPGQPLETEDSVEESLKMIKNSLSRGYDILLEDSKRAVHKTLAESKIHIEGISLEDRTLIDYSLLQLIGLTPDQTSGHSIGAKGLTGEGYRGHVFWDTEIYLLPFFANLAPQIARNLIRFRRNGLEEAREKAVQFLYKGALFPWEVTVDGKEKTPLFAQMNIHTGEANPVWSSRKEHHISADVAYSIKKFVEATNDLEFLYKEVFPIIIETAKFWLSRASWDDDRRCFRILDVIGPDEYTEHVDDNAYTNYMASENVKYAVELIQGLSVFPEYENKWNQVYDLNNLEKSFQEFVNKIFLPSPVGDNIIPQDSTFLTKPLIGGLEKYIHHPRKQAILQDFSRDEVVDHQVLKQADVVMLQAIIPELFSEKVKQANLDYYEPKTLHDSSLSPSMHAIAYADIGNATKAYEYFEKSLKIDVNDNFSDSNDGLHATALGGIWLALIRGFAGISTTSEQLNINPCLPSGWKYIHFLYRYLGNNLDFLISNTHIVINNIEPSSNLASRCFWIQFSGQRYSFEQNLKIERL